MDPETVDSPPDSIDPALLSMMGGGGPPQLPQQPPPNVSMMIPQGTDPNMVEAHAAAVHHNRLAEAANAVSNLLGGSKTIHLTKHPDGTVEMTHDPSTGGEKWGRIAAAALSGAAKGWANGQGPGGAGRAAGAGFDAGMEAQQAPEKKAREQIGEAQKEMLFKANMVKLHQDYLMNQQAMNQQGITFTEQQAEYMNKIEAARAADPTSVELGDFDGPQDVHTFAALHPEAVKGHLGNGSYLVLSPLPNGKTRAYTTSVADGDMMLTNPEPIPELYIKNGKIETKLISPNKIKKSVYDATYQQKVTANNALQLSFAREKREAIPKTLTEMIGERYTTTDPARQAQLDAAIAAEAKTPEQQAKVASAAASRASAAESYARAQQIRTQAQNEAGTPQQNAEMMVEGLSAPSQMSKRAKEYSAMLPLASAYSLQKYGVPFDAEASEARYRARQAVVKDFADGKEADQIQTFNQFLGHSQDFTDSIAGLRNTNSPLLNMPLNKLRKLSGRPEVASILPKLLAVRTEYENFLNNNHALHNEDVKEGKEMLDENASMAQMEAAAKSFARTALIRTGTINDRFKRTMKTNVPDILNNDSLKTLENYGLGDETRRILASQGHPAQGPPSGTFDVPAGGKVYHFNSQIEADAFKKKAGIAQ